MDISGPVTEVEPGEIVAEAPPSPRIYVPGWRYHTADDNAETRAAQLEGRRAAARVAHPPTYAKQPRVAVNKSTLDFSDNDGRRYRILWDEVPDGTLDLGAVPVYCKSGATTQRRFQDVTQAGDRITIAHKRSGEQVHVKVTDIGYSAPRGSYSGRLILDMSASGLTPQVMAPRERPPKRARKRSPTRSRVKNIPGAHSLPRGYFRDTE